MHMVEMLTWDCLYRQHMVHGMHLDACPKTSVMLRECSIFLFTQNQQLQIIYILTKSGKSWKVKFQQRWLDELPWLSYSGLLRGGICRCCILFTQGPKRGGSHGSLLGVFVLSSYQYPYNKALSKDGVLGSHEKNAVHVQAVE